MTLVNQTISHYKIVSLLDEGGMGEVYRARARASVATAIKTWANFSAGAPAHLIAVTLHRFD